MTSYNLNKEDSFNNIVDNILNQEDDSSNENTDEKKLFNLITNKTNKFNEKKTKLKEINDYLFLIRIINGLDDNEIINFFGYFNRINIPILKILINGYIEFEFEEQNLINKILEIISKTINIYFNKNIFYFIYKKLSKYYRKQDLIKDIKSIKKFDKLFNIWKLLYNYSNEIIYQNINDSSFSFFPFLEEEKKYIEIEIDDSNKIKEFTIKINFLPCPILNLNKINDKFTFIKLIDNKNETFELKYNDLNWEILEPFSKIYQFKINFFVDKCYKIFINKEIKFSNIKEDLNFDFSNVKKIEILNNFCGEISTIVFKKKYGIIDDYSDNYPILERLKMEIKKDKNNNEIQIITNAYKILNQLNENNNEKNIKLFSYQYCGASFNIKINSNIIKNFIWKRTKISLSELEYFGGLNSFIPIFKIIKNLIDKIKSFSDEKNNLNETEKFEISSNVDDYIDQVLVLVKDILKTMLKLICLSENNFKNFKKIITSLICSLSEIYHSINKPTSSKLIPDRHISFLFNDEVFSTLYILILISSLPINIKNIYRKIVGINENLDNLKLSMDSIIFTENNKIKNTNWYFTILIMYIEFILIYFNSSKKVPPQLINQIKSFLIKNEKDKDDVKTNEATIILIKIIENFCNEGKNNNSENIINNQDFINDNNIYFKFIVHMLTAFLNIKSILNIKNIKFKENSFLDKFIKFFENYFTKKEKINITEDYVQMVISFINFPEDILFIQKLFPFFSDENFIKTNELLMEELIDYHGQYHHLMKELFVFNRLWSNQKIFFHNTLEGIKNSKLKYKTINYYTRNFQRPLIYPVLDYKKCYPKFSSFEIKKDFYIDEEENDDYNFEIDSPELDEFIQEYNKIIFEKIENNKKSSINIFEVCLVKQIYHIKGNLFIFNENNKMIIYFYSYPNNLENNEKVIQCCNKEIKEKEEEENNKNKKFNLKNNLCYGSIFKSQKKQKNKKIKIEFEDIRLFLNRVYFYRNSALEIFTETKSYYFNFMLESDRSNLFLLFMSHCQKSFFPINVKGTLIGFMKLNDKVIEKNNFDNLINKSNNFIEFISNQTSKGELCEMCVFDIIMILNLISNRSYNDLYQYPVFPLLYFYDKTNNNIINRDLKEHIGFQELTEKSKVRKKLFLDLYEETVAEIEEIQKFGESETEIDLHCFNTHYSNSIYTSNFLIRLFPYSFAAIEFQGNSFDNPNRLFFSINESFYNTSTQKSDLRELIPEFFYFPEMFMNINSINFQKRSNGEPVDDVEMPILSKKNNKKADNNKIDFGEIIIDDFSVVFTDNIKNKKQDYKLFFTFIDFMKSKLENLKDWTFWINIIFGTNQKFSSKNFQFFRSESYISLNNNKYEDYLKDDILMNSVEFGLIPLQTIYDNKILNNLSNRKNEYSCENNISKQKTKKEPMKPNKSQKNIKKDFNAIKDNDKASKNGIKKKESLTYINVDSNDYWDEQLKIEFKIYNDYGIGKLELYKNNILINEIIDHSDKIIDFFYNRRLNMFATTSYDGFASVYILPNKLFCMIKHPKLYFDKIFLSSNPFPTIITYGKSKKIFCSYSMSGILIMEAQIKNKKEYESEIKIEPIFNIYGGATKDKLKISFKSDKKTINEYYILPFFYLDYIEELNQ